MPRQVVIMVAGQSTRTFPLTLTRPKALLPVMDKPILTWQLEALRGLVEEVVLVVGYRAAAIQAHYGEQWEDLKIRYVHQTETRGTGHAVLQCRELVSGDFLVMNGDDIYAAEDLAKVAVRPGLALCRHVADPRLFGIYEVDDAHRVIRLVEKPTEVFSHLANIGVYHFPERIFDILESTPPSPRNEIEITSALQTLAQEEAFHVVESTGHWLPIGYPWHLLEANEFAVRQLMPAANYGQVDSRAQLNGAVYVGHGAVIRAGVVIDGPAYIGDEAEVGPNCWLRPGATLCRGAKVGQASEIKNSILFANAKAPHHNYVGDSIVGENANLGCGTVTANLRHDGGNVLSSYKGQLVDTGRRKFGAILGDHVHTGIHTALLPGRKLGPHQWTEPGEILRHDRDAETPIE